MSTLYMIQLGARPKGRLIEQHDIFFGVADKVSELIPAVNKYWCEVENKWHIDSYRAVTLVDGYQVKWCDTAVESELATQNQNDLKLFFINLGGYQRGSIEEFHHKLLIVAKTQAEAIKQAKNTDFYRQFGYEDSLFDATSHIDDKMQVDVDDIYDVNGLISSGRLIVTPVAKDAVLAEDKNNVGYLSIKKLVRLGL